MSDIGTTSWEEVARNYYCYIDAGDYPALYSLFDDRIEYLRDGTLPIRGMDALKQFYTKGRIIASGSHTDLVFSKLPNSLATTGRFSGVLKNGELINVRFEETFFFGSDGKIIRRTTTFPKGERKV